MKRTPIRKRRPGTRRPSMSKLGSELKGAKPTAIAGVKVLRDGREVCNQFTSTGRREYRKRTEEMAARKNQICCLFEHSPVCHPRGLLMGYVPTFEHENGRGMGGGHRDDRIVLPDGRWQNGAAHAQCNIWKGSRRIVYNEPLQRQKGSHDAIL